jgi:hypothetical protein
MFDPILSARCGQIGCFLLFALTNIQRLIIVNGHPNKSYCTKPSRSLLMPTFALHFRRFTRHPGHSSQHRGGFRAA